MEKDFAHSEECGNVLLISPETVRGWNEGGFCQIPDDIYYSQKFQDNDDQRMRLKVSKKSKLIDFVTLVRRKVKYPT